MPEAIEIVGRYEAVRTLNAYCVRLDHPQAAAPLLWGVLDEEYEGRFDEWYPAMYETGATRDAWTDDNADFALRDYHRGGIEFGSTLYYNRFHSGRLLKEDHLVTERLAQALAYYFVPPEDEMVPSWYRPRDPATGQFLKRWVNE